MPVDATRVRAVGDYHEKVTEAIRQHSLKLASMDNRDVENTSKQARVWMQNISDLKDSLDEQFVISAEMRESATDKTKEQAEAFHEKYSLLMEMLKADVRTLFSHLKEHVDLPQDFHRGKVLSWDHMSYDLEMELKGLSAANAGKDLLSVDPVAHLLNYRDEIMSLMLQSMLFKKAVLDWDLKSERAYADGPMVAMAELAVNIYSKIESLPARHRPQSLPKTFDLGPFTYSKKQEEKGATQSNLTSLQCQLLAVLREMRSMEKGFRNAAFGNKVHVQSGKQKDDGTSSSQRADELKEEAEKWSSRCRTLQQELDGSKDPVQNELEDKVAALERKLEEKDTANKKTVGKIHKLEGDAQSMRYELQALQREKADLTEQNARIAKESLPVIEKLKVLTDKSIEATERLTKDSALLSSTFRKQVQETKRIRVDTEQFLIQLSKEKSHLELEQNKNTVKEAELQRKETLYLRTMAARKSIQDSFHEQKDRIAKVEESMDRKESERQELLKIIQARDGMIAELEEDLRRANHRIDELKEQREMAMEEFKSLTGRPFDFSTYKVAPTLPH